jgi:hypothetical protein
MQQDVTYNTLKMETMNQPVTQDSKEVQTAENVSPKIEKTTCCDWIFPIIVLIAYMVISWMFVFFGLTFVTNNKIALVSSIFIIFGIALLASGVNHFYQIAGKVEKKAKRNRKLREQQRLENESV